MSTPMLSGGAWLTLSFYHSPQHWVCFTRHFLIIIRGDCCSLMEGIHSTALLIVTWNWQSLSILMANFPGERGLASFIGTTDAGSGGDPWAIRCAKLQSNSHRQQSNTQCFTGRMPFLSPNQQCQSTEGKDVTITYRNYLPEMRLKTAVKLLRLSANRTFDASAFSCITRGFVSFDVFRNCHHSNGNKCIVHFQRAKWPAQWYGMV